MKGALDMAVYAGTADDSPYDALARRNREYARLLRHLADLARHYAVGARRVADLGCGTGNVGLAIHDALPDDDGHVFTFADANQAMLAIARSKIDARGLAGTIQLARADLRNEAAFRSASFDLINVTHALNCTGEPERVLRHLRRWLVPGGTLVVADIGRPVVIGHWLRGILTWVADDYHSAGAAWPLAWSETLHWLWRNRAAVAQNRRGRTEQRQGTFPLHSTDELLGWFRHAGFEILEHDATYYRDPVTGVGLDDVVVARAAG